MEYLWSDYGIIRREVNYKGTIRMPLNLTTFPFDNQIFRLTVFSKWSLYVNFHHLYESDDYLLQFLKTLSFYGMLDVRYGIFILFEISFFVIRYSCYILFFKSFYLFIN